MNPWVTFGILAATATAAVTVLVKIVSDDNDEENARDEKRLRIEEELQGQYIERDKLARTRDSHSAKIDQLESEITNYANFDIERTELRINEIKEQIDRCKKEEDELFDEILKIVAAVETVRREYTSYDAELEVLMRRKEFAEDYERRLSVTTNPYERRRIHDQCEAIFDNGRPINIIRECDKGIASCRRSLGKLRERANGILARFDRNIDEIAIDGSNLCYIDETFIGLRAIAPLLVELLRQIERITIFFDGSICRRLEANNREIKQMLLDKTKNSDDINVYVCPVRESADAYLLRYASGRDKERLYILSNDRYSEFPEYEVVRSARIIGFVILNDRLIVDQLDIEVKVDSE